MNSPSALPKAERLHSLTALRRLFAEGESDFIFPFRYTTYCDEGEGSGVEVLVSVPKRYHKRANKRNLLKRRMREAYRQNKSQLVAQAAERGKQIDLALVYSTKEILPYKSIEHAICRILERVATRY